MFLRLSTIRAVACLALASASTQGAIQFLTNGGFELPAATGQTPTGWTRWVQTGAATTGTANSTNDAAWASASGMWLSEENGGAMNGGFYQKFNSSAAIGGGPMLLAGIWRSEPIQASTNWGEVIYFDDNGVFTPANGSDIDTNAAVFRDGILTNGELLIKRDTFAQTGGWDTAFSNGTSLAFKSPAVTIVAGGLQFNAPTTGTNLLVLKAGNTQNGPITGVDYDSISLTPEPTTLLLLALPSVALLRRRVRHA